MVGIVIVSHSARLADGVVELAREMAGPDVKMVAAGGMDLPDRPLARTRACPRRQPHTESVHAYRPYAHIFICATPSAMLTDHA